MSVIVIDRYMHGFSEPRTATGSGMCPGDEAGPFSCLDFDLLDARGAARRTWAVRISAVVLRPAVVEYDDLFSVQVEPGITVPPECQYVVHPFSARAVEDIVPGLYGTWRKAANDVGVLRSQFRFVENGAVVQGTSRSSGMASSVEIGIVTCVAGQSCAIVISVLLARVVDGGTVVSLGCPYAVAVRVLRLVTSGDAAVIGELEPGEESEEREKEDLYG
ncbi:MAG TPA: hypothetical protein VJV23_16640 [Candidatus Polarisedimenticolia bacterium]|nr:hypothetical protein [Candidatus Polarisedimenticolia bacterium]